MPATTILQAAVSFSLFSGKPHFCTSDVSRYRYGQRSARTSLPKREPKRAGRKPYSSSVSVETPAWEDP